MEEKVWGCSLIATFISPLTTSGRTIKAVRPHRGWHRITYPVGTNADHLHHPPLSPGPHSCPHLLNSLLFPRLRPLCRVSQSSLSAARLPPGRLPDICSCPCCSAGGQCTGPSHTGPDARVASAVLLVTFLSACEAARSRPSSLPSPAQTSPPRQP